MCIQAVLTEVHQGCAGTISAKSGNEIYIFKAMMAQNVVQRAITKWLYNSKMCIYYEVYLRRAV